MIIKHLIDCPLVIANDNCALRELLHPESDGGDLPYSIAVTQLAVGERSRRHRLHQTEVYYLLDGSAIIHVGGEARPVCAGDAIVIPAGTEQWIENSGANTLRFLAIVSPPWRTEDDIRLES